MLGKTFNKKEFALLLLRVFAATFPIRINLYINIKKISFLLLLIRLVTSLIKRTFPQLYEINLYIIIEKISFSLLLSRLVTSLGEVA